MRELPGTTTARLHFADVVDRIPGNYPGLVVNAAIRWSSDGSAIYYARTTGTTTSGPDNWRSEVARVDVANDKRTPITGIPTDASVAVADIVLLPIDDMT